TLICVTLPQAVQPPIPVQRAGELDQAQVVRVLLVVPHQDPTALRQPRQRSLHHPTTRLGTWLPIGGRHHLPTAVDVRDVVRFGRRFPAGGILVAPIQRQVLWLLLRRLGALDHDGFDRRAEHPPLQHVGPGDHHSQWPTVPFDHQRLLGAHFPAIGGVLAHLFPPRTGPCPAPRRHSATSNRRPPTRPT